MKTINSLFAVLVLSLGTVIFSGNAYAFFDVVPMNFSEKPLVKIVVPKNQQTFVSITNSMGDVLYTETMSKDNPSTKAYNLSNLENGVYTFNSISEQANVTKKVSVDDSFVEILSKDVEYKPVFSIKDDKLMISYLNLEREDVEIRIDNTLYDFYYNNEGNPMSINKVLNISEMFNGEYRAQIKAGNKVYDHYFRVQ